MSHPQKTKIILVLQYYVLQKILKLILQIEGKIKIKARSEEKLQMPLQTFLRQFSTKLNKILCAYIKCNEEGGSGEFFQNFPNLEW